MFRFALLGAAAVAVGAKAASAAVFASSVGFYEPGIGAGGFTNPSVALGSPAPLTGDGLGFPNILSPFSPPFEADEIVGVGRGGVLQVNFDIPISDVPGPDFGVFTNVGLVDVNFPNGVNSNPASTFNPLPRAAKVSVSADGNAFVSLGSVTFSQPTNYFVNASNPYLSAAPGDGVIADFGKPFTGGLSTFNGLDWTQTLAALDGSGGGTWIDFSATNLGSIVAVRISIDATPPTGIDGRVFVDAVAAHNAAVPEPIGALLLAPLALLRRHRR